MTFEELCNRDYRREEQKKYKSEAVWSAFIDLDGLINKSEFARKYLNKSQGWFSQRLNGNKVNGEVKEFTEPEYGQIATAFREIAALLSEYADSIDNGI